MKTDTPTSTSEAPRLYKPKEVLALLGLASQPSLRSLERRGLLKPIRINSRVYRYDSRDVSKLLAGGMLD